MVSTPTPLGGGRPPVAGKPAPAPLPPLPAEVRASLEYASGLLDALIAGYGPSLPPGPVQRQLSACRGRLHDARYHFDRAHQRPDGTPWA